MVLLGNNWLSSVASVPNEVFALLLGGRVLSRIASLKITTEAHARCDPENHIVEGLLTDVVDIKQRCLKSLAQIEQYLMDEMVKTLTRRSLADLRRYGLRI